MQIIMFTGDNPEKILSGQKTMTARHWLRKPPALSSLFRAQRGRKKETAFAVCKVVGVLIWDGCSSYEPCNFLECTPKEIGKREGYQDWSEFYEAYRSLNAHNGDDPKRTHYFVEFEVIESEESLFFKEACE